METVVFGRTGLAVSVAGLGGGGDSRLGLVTGSSEPEAITVIRRAVELGVTYFDTSPHYGTEAIFGSALQPFGDSVIISTKAETRPKRTGVVIGEKDLRASLETSLRALRRDYIDLYQLHAVAMGDYEYCAATLVPVLARFRDEGLIRCIGISEPQTGDAEHEMISRALDDDVWDAVMFRFSLLNQSARTAVFKKAIAKDVGVQVMSCVRGPFKDRELFRAVIDGYIAQGLLSSNMADLTGPLGILLAGDSAALIDAAYRYARHEPGCHIVLTGTGNTEHLAANVASIVSTALSPTDCLCIEQALCHLRFPDDYGGGE